MNQLIFSCFVGALFLAVSSGAQAPAHKGMTFQGYLKDSSGNPVTASSIAMTSRLVSSGGCVLLEETHVGVNIVDGFFNVVLGKGSRGAGDKGLTLKDVFSNSTARTGFNHTDGAVGSCNYTPSSSDARSLQLSFPLGADTIKADFNVRANAFSVWSESTEDAEKLGGKAASGYLQVNTAAQLTQAKLEEFITALTSVSGGAIRWNGSNFVSYDPSDASYLATGAIQNAAIQSVAWSKVSGVPSALTQIAGLSCASGKVLKFSGAAWACGDDDSGGGGGSADDLSSITGTGVVQRNGAASYSTLGVNAPLSTSGSALGLVIGDGLTLSSGTLVVDTGTGAGQIPQLDGSGKLSTGVMPSGWGGGASVVIPQFSVHKNGTNQTGIAGGSGGSTLLTWSAEAFDSSSNFAANRFTPTVGGKYLVTLSLTCTDQSTSCNAHLHKNGTEIARSINRDTSVNATALISTIVDMNGSTDYLEAYAGGGGMSTVSGQAAHTFFTGSLLTGTASTPAGATGSLQFNDTGVMGAAAHWDSANGRMGIGTTSPTAELHVAGSDIDMNSVSLKFSEYALESLSEWVIESSGNLRFNRNGTNYLSIGTSGSAQITGHVYLTSGTDRTLSVTNASSSTPGNRLTISAGNSGSGSNLAGGELRLSSGEARGDQGSFASIYTATPGAAGSGTRTPTEKVRVSSDGSVGIGTASPRSRLDVSGGAITGAPAVSNGTTTINFLTGNTQYTASDCGSFQLNNLKNGASYMFAVQGTGVATCSFTAYSDTGSTPLTVHLPPNHGATTSGKHTMYSIVVMGSHAYFAWTPGY